MRLDYTFDLPNDLRAIETSVDYLMERGSAVGFDADRLRLNFRVGLTEALANAMLYGNCRDPGKRVRVEAHFDPAEISVRVTDEGRGFDPARVLDPTLPDNRTRAGGRGIFLIRNLMDHVEFNEQGNSITMVLRNLPGPPGPEPEAETIPALAELLPLPSSVEAALEGFRRAHPDRRFRLVASHDDRWIGLYVSGEPAGAEWVEAPMYRFEAGDGVPLAIQAPEDGLSAAEGAFLAEVTGRLFGHEREARSAARELTDRYEEINLLYFISEVLASVMSLPDAATRILGEVADVLGARRASLWVYRPEEKELHLTAAVGEGGMQGPIALDDAESATAWVFRERQPLNLERGTVLTAVPRLEPRPQGREAFLSVPINFTPPDGATRTIGVLTLVGRRSNVRFSAGDARLLSAIASQIGAALETQRLVQESLRQERLGRELELAHDLQLKLLPDPATFDAPARIAGRCVPADSVGGDFYQLFRLPGERLGIMIGDVSSHGFSAALIMALTMAAVGIHAPESGSPSEVLRRVHRALIDELESTEMYLSLFYAVLDPAAGTLVYANAGHPHAFRIAPDGTALRLGATDPPLGIISRDQFGEGQTEWSTDEDLLLLFTDGLSDALADSSGSHSGEITLVNEIVRLRNEPLGAILDHVFAAADRAAGHLPPDDKTALLVRT
ncbi:MAG: SpoIIE family protein phosphatase [Longimicrobiales bacterium]